MFRWTLAKTHGVAEEGRDETGTLSAEPYVKVTASVTICQVRNKDYGLNGLRRARVRSKARKRDASGHRAPAMIATILSAVFPAIVKYSGRLVGLRDDKDPRGRSMSLDDS